LPLPVKALVTRYLDKTTNRYYGKVFEISGRIHKAP